MCKITNVNNVLEANTEDAYDAMQEEEEDYITTLIAQYPEGAGANISQPLSEDDLQGKHSRLHAFC